MPRQMLPLASMLTRVIRARRRCSGSASALDRRAGHRVDQQRRVVAGGQAELGPPLRAAARSARDGGTSPRVSPAARPASVPAASSGRHTWSVPAITALRRKSARSSCSSPTASPSKDCDEPGPRGHPAVDRVRGEVVLQHHLGAAHARHARTPRRRRRRPSGTRSWARRNTSAAAAAPGRRRRPRRCTTATKPSEVIGSSSSGSRTASSAASRRAARVGAGPPGARGLGGHRTGHAPATSCARPARPGSRPAPAAGTRPAPRCRRAWPRSGRGSSSWSPCSPAGSRRTRHSG